MIAVKFGDLSDPKQLSGLIFIDAVTSFKKDYGGRVTEHPVETGVSISDHFISDNPKFQVQGVISGVDLSPIPFSINIEGNSPLNANPAASAISVNNIGSGLLKFLPDSVTQFLPNSVSNIIGGSERQDYRGDIENLLETLMNGVFYNEDRGRWENRMTLSTLYETEDGRLGKSYENCVMTGYSVSEDADSGDALFLDLSFEQVRFATSESAEAPSPAKGTPEARGASATKDKGTVSTTTATGAVSPDKDRAFSTDAIGT